MICLLDVAAVQKYLSGQSTSICLFCSAAIKVNCNGFCGITSKVNDTAWTQEEQYFNSTVSVADKGT